jgi:imidazoleglycerol-phosphate dehydratase/histidinol-phosphatase
MRLKKYTTGEYDLENSLVVGDRWSDMELAKNLGAKGILISSAYSKTPDNAADIEASVALKTKSWEEVYKFLIKLDRKASLIRKTNETNIELAVNLDGSGISDVNTGIGFYDHMLDQLAKHGGIDLFINVKGDLEIDEHHTIEDTAIALGQVFGEALGKKAGISRYGYCLPMDDVLAQVAIDFGGRPWIEWDVDFTREMVGEMPTELVYHFFKSFSDNAKCNLNMKAEGDNEHHKIEALFKAWAKSIKMAIQRDTNDMSIPSTKGIL